MATINSEKTIMTDNQNVPCWFGALGGAFLGVLASWGLASVGVTAIALSPVGLNTRSRFV